MMSGDDAGWSHDRVSYVRYREFTRRRDDSRETVSMRLMVYYR